MQREIDDTIHLCQTISPFDSIGKPSAVDRTASDFNNVTDKVKKIKQLIDRDECDADVIRYVPGTLDLAFQGMTD